MLGKCFTTELHTQPISLYSQSFLVIKWRMRSAFAMYEIPPKKNSAENRPGMV